MKSCNTNLPGRSNNVYSNFRVIILTPNSFQDILIMVGSSTVSCRPTEVRFWFLTTIFKFVNDDDVLWGICFCWSFCLGHKRQNGPSNACLLYQGAIKPMYQRYLHLFSNQLISNSICSEFCAPTVWTNWNRAGCAPNKIRREIRGSCWAEIGLNCCKPTSLHGPHRRQADQ